MSTGPARRVLVIEDQVLILMMLEEVLAEAGYCVDTASTGEDAIASARCAQPEVVVMDLVLTGQLWGAELLRQLRALSPAPLPVVVVTGYRLTNEQRRELDHTGGGPPISILSKPFSTEEFVCAVNSLLP